MTKCPVCDWEVKGKGIQVKIGGKIVVACCEDCAAKIKAELKKTGGLTRLHDEMFQRRMLEALIEFADVTEANPKPEAPEEEKA